MRPVFGQERGDLPSQQGLHGASGLRRLGRSGAEKRVNQLFLEKLEDESFASRSLE